MNQWGNLFKRLLNPRANFEGVPGIAAAFDEVRGVQTEAPEGSTPRLRARDILFNIPLLTGALIVVGLFLLVVFGPAWAPQNPYIAGQHIVPHYDFELQEFIRPPLSPSEEFPLGTDQWGNDILSLLMHGARNTLVASAFVTMMRILLGLLLGGLAGWREGSLTDRIIMGAIGLLTSLPLLISTMILIYALDIRRGLPVFIVAFSAIGWTEIAQYIRSEFLVLRKMPFIEGARASGLTNLQIAVHHVLPNILPTLLILAFLEMGAVLLLLGELGFVGVFIGGGSRIDLSEPMGPQAIFTLVEVPEWGAMLADGFRWLRSKPFVVFPPAAAFAIAVLGFNSLGEGLRRLIEIQTLNTSFLLRKRMLGIIGVLSLATVYIMNNTGAAPWFAKVAQAFDGNRAYEFTRDLVEMEGRGNGQEGGLQAASYIAEKFEAYGLEPAWKRSSYYLELETQLVHPNAQPVLSLHDETGNLVKTFQHQLDFGYVIEGHGGSGDIQAGLTLVGFDPEYQGLGWERFRGLDLRGQIVLLVQGNAPPSFATEALIRGAYGVLWVTGASRDAVRSQVQIPDPNRGFLETPSIPIFRIRPSVAQEVLAQDGISFTDAFQDETRISQSGPGWSARALSSQVRMQLSLGPPETVRIPSVLGYKPGSDLDIADEMVVLFVAYDGLGTDPDGTIYPGANHNAAGVGILLEIARVWQEQNLDPRRTTLFVAWGGSQLDEPGIQDWLSDPFSFRHLRSQSINANIRPEILFQFDYIGAGGDQLFVHPAASPRLYDLALETAAEAQVPIVAGQDTAEFSQDILAPRLPAWISLKWAGPPAAPVDDTMERIDREKLQSFGEMLSLAVTAVVRETTY